MIHFFSENSVSVKFALLSVATICYRAKQPMLWTSMLYYIVENEETHQNQNKMQFDLLVS